MYYMGIEITGDKILDYKYPHDFSIDDIINELSKNNNKKVKKHLLWMLGEHLNYMKKTINKHEEVMSKLVNYIDRVDRMVSMMDHSGAARNLVNRHNYDWR